MSLIALGLAIFTLLGQNPGWAGRTAFGPVSPRQAQSLVTLYSSPRASSLGMDRGFAIFMLSLSGTDMDDPKNAVLRDLLGPLGQAQRLAQSEEEILPKARELVLDQTNSAIEAARKPNATASDLEAVLLQMQALKPLALLYMPDGSGTWEELGAAYQDAQARLSALRQEKNRGLEDSAREIARALDPAGVDRDPPDISRLVAEIEAGQNARDKLARVDALADAARSASEERKAEIVEALRGLLLRSANPYFLNYVDERIDEITRSPKKIPIAKKSFSGIFQRFRRF